MPKLTKRAVDAAKAKSKDYFAWDDGDGSVKGFGLRVWPSGRKTFVFKYQLGGRAGATRRITIGDYGVFAPDQARDRAIQLAADVQAAKLDPSRAPATRRQAAREAVQAERSAMTVASLGKLFLADRRLKAKASTVREYERLMAREILPALGMKKVRAVERADMERLHASMSTRRAIANNVLAIVGAMFRFAEDRELSDGKNPCSRVTPYPKQSPKRSLTREQYAALGAAFARAEREGLPVPPGLKKQARGISRARREKLTGRIRGPYKRRDEQTTSPANPVTVAALRFLALSGWRESEVLSLRWDALDLDRSVAVLQDTKTGRSVRPLGSGAIDVIRALPRLEGSPYVFPGAKPGHHLKDGNRIWLAAKHEAGLQVRLHDLRHSFTTVARELGYSNEVIARLVGHTLDGMTARYGDVPDEIVQQAAHRVSFTIAQRMRGETAKMIPFMAQSAESVA